MIRHIRWRLGNLWNWIRNQHYDSDANPCPGTREFTLRLGPDGMFTPRTALFLHRVEDRMLGVAECDTIQDAVADVLENENCLNK